mmetsp:Transcript_26592/g.57155  ORF Transcript_26592/g.57155 Transcript_26592/m.57155 type:complete len:85 (+) Transcript_26592:134-388(+)
MPPARLIDESLYTPNQPLQNPSITYRTHLQLLILQSFLFFFFFALVLSVLPIPIIRDTMIPNMNPRIAPMTNSATAAFFLKETM